MLFFDKLLEDSVNLYFIIIRGFNQQFLLIPNLFIKGPFKTIQNILKFLTQKECLIKAYLLFIFYQYLFSIFLKIQCHFHILRGLLPHLQKSEICVSIVSILQQSRTLRQVYYIQKRILIIITVLFWDNTQSRTLSNLIDTLQSYTSEG